MIILGLTGSIAMGKSEAAKMLRRFGIPVFDSDACVHKLMGPGGAALAAIAEAFPETVTALGVDRAALGVAVFGHKDRLARLEAILHPRVLAAQYDFLREAERQIAANPHSCALAVLDIPLLFETGGDRRVDFVAVVSAPAATQRQRALARPQMSAEKLDAILAQQMPDAEKRARADYCLNSGDGKRVMLHDIAVMLRDLSKKSGSSWPWLIH
ncbi:MULTISPECIES: dephospho-CoA kinase [unclassified Iodidimonas]|jgi:dephospho-CoA kinase|uniref:dephospho-CoA kinase n=1 Tax=unclassified Iodidimonas TaxID=2626145 RepID=UPI00248304CB|nr:MULTISPECIES: dephospho-CoA kinase [unclassified Iodidimonas]